MSVLDKAIAAVTPPVSEETRREAHAKARSLAKSGDWLSIILDHHEEIDAAFEAVKSATTSSERRTAEKRLGTLLTGHTMAEEAVVYPALAQAGEKGEATTGYTEQAAAKMQMAALEVMDPMSQDYLDKLGHLEGAVKTHVYQEESKWFPKFLKEASPADSERVTARYREEFERYMGGETGMGGTTARTGLGEARSFSPAV